MRIALLLTGWLGAASALAEIAVEPFPAKLTNADLRTLEQLVCDVHHGLDRGRLDARARDREATRITAPVVCQPHGEFKGKPVRRFAVCTKEHGAWSCSEKNLEIVVSVSDREVTVRSPGIDEATAHDTISKLGARGWFRKDYDPTPIPACTVARGGAAELLDVRCAGWLITVTSWCPQGDCPRVLSSFRVED